MNLDVSTLTCHISNTSQGKGYTVFHWKALNCNEYEPRGLSCGSTLNIHQDVLKSENLLHKQGFVDFQFGTTLSLFLKRCTH